MYMRVWQTRPVNNSEWTAADDAVACLLPMSARDNRILHIDGDSFFASCEIALDPKLEGRPVWVGGGRRGDGIVIAANRQAKKYGIKTGTACFEAKRLCPSGVLCRPHYDAYRELSRQMFLILEQYAPTLVPYSIDEGFLDFSSMDTHIWRNTTPTDYVQGIRSRIARETRLPVTAGLANSAKLAKLATDAAKGVGFIEVPPGRETAMKKDGTLFYSPTDLIRFMESQFATWMERLHLEFPSKFQPDEETDEQKLVAKTGNQHEEKFLQKLLSERRDVCVIQKTDLPLAIKQTLSAINEGREIIYQAHLALPPFRGFADFLVRDGKPSPGLNRYEVWDTKLARKTKPYYLIQLCCYAEMLEKIQGIRPQKLRVVLGDNSIPEFRTDDFFYYYRTLKQAFLRQMDKFDPDHPPVPDPRADHGRWSSYAEKYLIEKNHLIQVAGITIGQIKKLNKAGINKVSELVGSRDKSVPKLSRDVMIRLAEQASLQVATRDLRAKAKPNEIVRPTFLILKPDANDPRRGLATLPPSSVGDVFFDMEGFPLVEGGLEYLFGASHLDKDGKLRFQDWWAHDSKEEKAAFEGFVDWAYARWKADPPMHIYHYAKYEVSALRRLMGRYGTREDEVDNLLRNEVFIDLYQIVRQGLRIGEPSYSIKDVEHLYREKRSGDVTAAGESIVYYANWIESGQPRNWNSSDILRKIRDYNKDDCDSLVLLIDWLRNQQNIQGIVYIPVRINLPESETKVVDPLIAARIELANRLRTQIPENVEERKKDADKWLVQEMLSHLIEFHRRENKPVWWRMFDRHALTADELKEDINCLGDLALDSNPPIQVKKSLVFTYSFDPNQDNKIREGDRVILSHDLSVKFTVEAFDPDGRIQLKISVKMLNERLGGRMPKTMSLIPDEFVNPSPIPEAIVDVATKWDRTKAVPENLRRLLLRLPPYLSGKNPADPLAKTNEDIGAAAVRIVTDMQNSVLCIQGPPGCGKTTTASGVIVKLLKTSKNIGITSNSHKAIINLLSACNDKLAGKLQGIKAGGDGNDPIFTKCPGLVHVGVSGDAASQFSAGLIAEAHKLARTGGRGKSAGGFMARSALRRDSPPMYSEQPNEESH
jgi:uncharacterized protein